MKTRKQTAEQTAFRARRHEILKRVQQAIDAGKAYLDTAFGRHLVLGYNDETGNCVTVPTGMTRWDGYMNRRTFMVTLESIKIEA